MFVALRKESVDRNRSESIVRMVTPRVALRKESVDRNSFLPIELSHERGRSPQGERG